MKTIAGLIGIVVIVAVVIFIGCIEEKSPEPVSTPTLTATPTPKPTLPTEIEVPIWDLNDCELEKRSEEMARLSEVIVFLKPAFYRGSVPFTYESYTMPAFPKVTGGPWIEVAYKFEDFTVLFIYKNDTLKFMGIPDGAIAISTDNGGAANARFLGFVEGENNTRLIKIEEFHYEDGEIIFYCKSLINSAGEKVQEVESVGKKDREYFFIYSTSEVY